MLLIVHVADDPSVAARRGRVSRRPPLAVRGRPNCRNCPRVITGNYRGLPGITRQSGSHNPGSTPLHAGVLADATPPVDSLYRRRVVAIATLIRASIAKLYSQFVGRPGSDGSTD